MSLVTHNDEFGSFVVLRIDTGIFPLSVVLKAAYWVSEFSYLFFSLDQGEERVLSVEIRPKQDQKRPLLQVAGEFSNQLVDFSLRERIEKETEIIRNVIVKKAFSEALSKKERSFLRSQKLDEKLTENFDS